MITLAMSGANTAAAFQIPAVSVRQIGGTTTRTSLAMSSAPATGEGKGLQYNPDEYKDEKNAGNYRKLSQALEVSNCEHVIPLDSLTDLLLRPAKYVVFHVQD